MKQEERNAERSDDFDEPDRRHKLRASLVRAKEQIDRGEYVEWSPTFMDELTRDVCP
jgi:hypothetical protein